MNLVFTLLSPNETNWGMRKPKFKNAARFWYHFDRSDDLNQAIWVTSVLVTALHCHSSQVFFLSLNACLSVSVHPPFNTHSLLIILYLGISILEDQDQESFSNPVMLLLLMVFSFSFTFYLLSLVVPCYDNDIFYWNAIIFLVFLTIS